MNRSIIVVVGVLVSFSVRAQSNLNLQPRAEETLRAYEARMEAYFAPEIARVGVDALVEEEGSDYNQYRNFLHTWQIRLGPKGDFRLRFRQDAMQFGTGPRGRTARNGAVAAGIGIVANDVAWQELGPTVMPGGGNPAAGIGPIEFITFYEPAPSRMLAGSTMGGLFSSRNAGLTWQQTGTDTKIGRSGVMSAVFHPGSFQTWFAASSGNPDNNLPLWIGPTGGIFRTVDEGAVWTKIASDAQLGGVWTQIYKLVIDPSNGNNLWAATSRGLYFTSNAMAPAPAWNVVTFNGELVNDFELRPGNSSWQYAAVATPLVGGGYTNWRLMHTSDGGMTWQLVPNQSPSTATASGITIEVSPANAGNLYTAIMKPTFTTTLAVHDLGSGARHNVTTGAYVSHGSGHGFGVDPFDPDEIFLNDSTRGRRYDASSGASVPFPAGTNIFHDDIEDIVPHPVNPNEVWAAHHGGIAMSPDNGANWFDRSTGLGVAVTLRMADAASDSRYLLLGLYHDGSILTDSPWHDFWSPSWRIVGCCDGLTPLIDPLDSQNMWITEQFGRWYRSTNTGQTFSIRGPASPNWEVDAAFDMLNPSTQYRIVTNAGIREIHRSFDKGNTWKRISRFDLLWPAGTSEYVLWRVYTPENASGTLVVHLLERPNHNVDWHHHLYRTKFANDRVRQT